jgi:hypothetical protein
MPGGRVTEAVSASLDEKLQRVTEFEQGRKTTVLTRLLRRVGPTRAFAAVDKRLGPAVDPWLMRKRHTARSFPAGRASGAAAGDDRREVGAASRPAAGIHPRWPHFRHRGHELRSDASLGLDGEPARAPRGRGRSRPGHAPGYRRTRRFRHLATTMAELRRDPSGIRELLVTHRGSQAAHVRAASTRIAVVPSDCYHN